MSTQWKTKLKISTLLQSYLSLEQILYSYFAGDICCATVIRKRTEFCCLTKKEQDNKSLSDARITEFPKIPIVPRNKTHKKQRRLRRVKRRYKKKYPKFRSKLRIISNPKKQLHPKPWNSFSSYSPSDPYYAPTSTPFKLSSQSQIRTPAITHAKFNFPLNLPSKTNLAPQTSSSSLKVHKFTLPSCND